MRLRMGDICVRLFVVLWGAAVACAVAWDVSPACREAVRNLSDCCDGDLTPTELVEVVAYPPQLREAHLVFVGDVMAHLPQVESARVGEERFDFGPHFEGVEELFAEADYVVGNLETTLSPRPPYSGYPAFASPEELARDLKSAGFDALTIANNHTADHGVRGVLHTVAGLDNAGLDYVGARVPSLNQGRTEPLVVEVGGFKVALMAYTYGANGPIPEGVELPRLDTLTMRRHIEAVREEADFVVASIHWGVEYMRRPTKSQRELAEWLHVVGVDCIIGSHPHVVQPFEGWYDESGRCVGGVFYSLGNFISNQPFPYTDFGLAAHLRLREVAVGEVEVSLSADTVRCVRSESGAVTDYRLEVKR